MGGSKRRKASVLNKQTRKGKEPTPAEINQLVALFNTGRHAEMETLARTLADRRPDSGIAWKALGVSLQTQGKDSLSALQKAAKLLPEDADAHINLGNALKNLGRLDSAEASYRRAMELSQNILKYAFYAHLLLPIIPDSVEAIEVWRANYQNGIAALLDMPGYLDEPGITVNPMSFYLAYHNQDNRALMEALRHLFRARVPGLTFTAPHIPGWQSPVISGKRIRVGFISEYLMTEHTIGKHYKGFIQHLDRSRFEVLLIHTLNTRHEVFSKELDCLADKVLTLPARLKDQQQMVADEKLDVLFYPDIGMAPFTYFLAYARLAPVQATSWGHPDTSGLDTIDYYVSSASNEPEDAEAYYTERLIRLNRLPCFYYQTPDASPRRLTRAELGLPETGTLYGCPQGLFKLHPDLDAIFAAIAEGDPTGHIVLPQGNKHPAWTDLLKARWEKSFPGLLNHVVFMPRMPWDRFMEVLAHMDVLLDPLHFGSGNTLYDAMVCGTPVVTWPGRFARGRNVAAAYRQMGASASAWKTMHLWPWLWAGTRCAARLCVKRHWMRQGANYLVISRRCGSLKPFWKPPLTPPGAGKNFPPGGGQTSGCSKFNKALQHDLMIFDVCSNAG